MFYSPRVMQFGAHYTFLMTPLFELLSSAQVYDLAQPYFTGMPHHPSHPPFLFSLVKQHGEYVGPAGNSSASDAMALGSHVGTHIDALCHFSCGGKLHGGEDGGRRAILRRRTAAATRSTPWRRSCGAACCWISPRWRAFAALPEDFEMTPAHLERGSARASGSGRGDVVLLRTGWARIFATPGGSWSQVHGPGPGLAGAQWLSARGIFAAGSDTVAFEKVPDAAMPVHVHLLVESGIHIIECLNLEELAADGVTEFLFVGAPLKIRGATGAPLRPLAVVE